MVSKGRPARGRLYNLWSPQRQADTNGSHAAQSRTQHIHVCAVKEDRLAHAIYTMATGIQTGESRPAAAILLRILMSLCLALALLLVDIVRRAVVESIKARMNG